MIVPTFHGRVDEAGRLGLLESERQQRQSYLSTLAGKSVDVVVKVHRQKRTYDQLKYWFGVPMKRLSDHTGYTKMQMHYLCLAICFGVTVDELTGREVPIVPASRHLTAQQMGELIEWCPPWAFETYNGIEIPLPERVDLDSLPGVPDDAEAA